MQLSIFIYLLMLMFLIDAEGKKKSHKKKKRKRCEEGEEEEEEFPTVKDGCSDPDNGEEAMQPQTQQTGNKLCSTIHM